MITEIGPGVAVELADGIFNVVGEWHYSSMALEWWVWELDTGEGQTRLLARVGETFHTPAFEPAEAMPATDTLDVDGAQFALQRHGEARVERSSGNGRDFWLAKFREYVIPGGVLFFTADKDGMHRMRGAELDAKLVQVYRG